MSKRQFAVVTLGWALFGVLNAIQLYLGILAESPTMRFSIAEFVPWQAGRWMLWALLTPAVVWLSRRFPLSLRVKPIATHLAFSALVPFIRSLGMVVVDMQLEPDWGRARGPLEIYMGDVSSYFHFDLLVYWAIVGVVYAIDSHRRLRERELLLAQSQLANLRLQIQPHFLFNTLHTIASLVRDGKPQSAVTMIAGLSDLLRYSLDNAGRNVVPLSEELEVVKKYLEIQQTRFSDRLRITVDVAPETNDAAVPTMLLQPLVENAIRHGDPTQLDVRARRDGDTLVVEIANDGAALAPDWRKREGVGLSSTRRRLEQLYPTSAVLELENQQPSGVITRVRIPFSREYA